MVLVAVPLLALVAVACGSVVAVQQPRLGQEITLALGESVRLADADLRVGFDAVLEDSRCPRDEGIVCVWEGDAVVAVTLAAPACAAPTTVELHTSRRFATAADHRNHRVELVSLTEQADELSLRVVDS